MRRKIIQWSLAATLATAASAFAVEDGLGTNHVRNLRATEGIVLGDERITSWDQVASSTLTNNSVSTAMIQDGAVTADKVAAAVAGDGLTGGAGTAVAVGQGDGISVTADAVAVDASVVRTNDAQAIRGVKTFVDSPIVPTPTTDYQAATKLYVDDKLSSSVADGSADNQTLRWDGNAWTNSGGLMSDASGNTTVGGTLKVTGVQTNVSDLVVEGNTTLGNAGTDTITFTAKAGSDLDMDSTYQIVNLAAPSANGDAATKLYVDNLVNGLSWKDSVRVASTANGLIASAFANGQTVDGIVLATGDRILLKNQTTQNQNGIYEVQASGAPARVADLDATAELGGAAVFVSEGTANEGTAWVCTSPEANVGVDAISFAQFASPGTYLAGDGLDLTGLTFSAKPSDFTGTGLEVDSGDIRIASSAAGDGLTGGSGSALAVDASVVRTNGAQAIRGVKTFVDAPIIPTPTGDYEAATKLYVDGKVGASIANGSSASQLLRWDGNAWTNIGGLLIDASGNATVVGTSVFSNTAAFRAGVTIGDAASDVLLIEATMTNKAAAVFEGNVTLGDASGDSITFNGTSASDLAMGTHKVSGLGAPTANTDAATKLYVDNLVNGLSWKDSAKVATASARTLASDFENGDTVDGVVLATGDRILIKNQASAVQNGIYTVNASGAPTRTDDMNADGELAGAAVFVSHGTANAGTAWVCTSPDVTLDSGEVTFAQFASPGTYTAGHALTLTGLEFAVDPTALAGSDMEVNSGTLRLAATAAGDGLTGGAGTALAVGAGDGISVAANAVAVDASVVRTNGAQAIRGVKTFVDAPIVPTPTADYEAATKLYVDGKVGASIANGTAANQTLRWDGNAWTNEAGLMVDASGNAGIEGTLAVTGAVTLAATTTSTTKDTGALVVEGGVGIEENLNVGGTADIAGAVTLADTTGSTDKDTGALIVDGGVGVEENVNIGGNADVTGSLTIDGSTTLGDAGSDAVTVNAAATLNSKLITAPSGSTVEILAAAGITDISRAYMQIRGNGGSVDISANPQIVAGTAGQILTIQGMSDANWVKFDDGNGLKLESGVSFTLKNGYLIQFIFDGTDWRETYRQVLNP
ncbi:MAG: hypothetical protein PHP44_10145 [Kiritimatiellae bacterium]|nr:hypothetical protein [Kiritimatiellia bacterium]